MFLILNRLRGTIGAYAKVQEAKQYLQSTDHKFYLGYKPKEGEDLVAIEAKRDEAREYIRMNEVA